MPRRSLAAFVVLAAHVVSPGGAAAERLPAAEELLARTIRHHDPEERWGRVALRLALDEARPDGTSRTTFVEVDPGAESFTWTSRRGADVLWGELSPSGCTLTLNGSTDIPEAAREEHRLTCERLELFRDYYLYLWGLPMKLRDPGTLLDPQVRRTDFEGRAALALRVTYDPAVGSDTWDFFFDPDSSALIGYRFFHDEKANDGEYITLAGELAAHGFRLPKNRTWFTNTGRRLLGTDTLTGLEARSPSD